MKKPIYRFTTKTVDNGDGSKKVIHVKEVLTPRQIKQEIMKAHGWTSQEYRNKYHLFKNKLRTYENYQLAHMTKEEKSKFERQSPVNVLYTQAQALKRYKGDYKPSAKMRQIESFSAYSITKGKTLAQDSNSNYRLTRDKAYRERVLASFNRLIEDNKKAEEIAKNVKDPVQLEKALSDFAEKLHLDIKESQEEQSDESPFASSETIGSDDTIEFDYSAYMV